MLFLSSYEEQSSVMLMVAPSALSRAVHVEHRSDFGACAGGATARNSAPLFGVRVADAQPHRNAVRLGAGH